MTVDTDRPLPVTETYWVVYHLETGAIVATETVWTEEGAPADEPGSTYRSIDSIVSDLAAQAGPLGVLEVRELPVGAMRVDLASRTVVAGEHRVAEGLAEPAVFARP